MLHANMLVAIIMRALASKIKDYFAFKQIGLVKTEIS